MGIRKDTQDIEGQRVHIWTDDRTNFGATTVKEGHAWRATTLDHGEYQTFSTYQAAVDWIMDQWRAKRANDEYAKMAEDMGGDLSDDERQDLLEGARLIAEMES